MCESGSGWVQELRREEPKVTKCWKPAEARCRGKTGLWTGMHAASSDSHVAAESLSLEHPARLGLGADLGVTSRWMPSEAMQ